VLALANAHDEATIDKLNADYVGGLDEFTRAVNTDFGIDTITWSET
jgi:hypothetical protein